MWQELEVAHERPRCRAKPRTVPPTVRRKQHLMPRSRTQKTIAADDPRSTDEALLPDLQSAENMLRTLPKATDGIRCRRRSMTRLRNAMVAGVVYQEEATPDGTSARMQVCSSAIQAIKHITIQIRQTSSEMISLRLFSNPLTADSDRPHTFTPLSIHTPKSTLWGKRANAIHSSAIQS